MMDALVYLKNKRRMCKETTCADCKLSLHNNDEGLHCEIFTKRYPEQAIKVVEEWTQEHPAMTNENKYLQIIKETFNLKAYDLCCINRGVPKALCERFDSCNECAQFWQQEYDENIDNNAMLDK